MRVVVRFSMVIVRFQCASVALVFKKTFNTKKQMIFPPYAMLAAPKLVNAKITMAD